jgi:hypothetical protein
MGSSTRTFAMLGDVALAAIILAGVGLKSVLGHPKPLAAGVLTAPAELRSSEVNWGIG